MNQLKPVFTKKADCQDCYKCIRECPVKAIRIEDNSACIIDELCIHCGRCVKICPVGAKQIRNDVPAARQILNLNEKSILSIAPSWRAEFRNIHSSQLIQALRKLGFAEISETALGAQIVSQAVADYIENHHQNLYLSTACPTVVDLICRYYPQYAAWLTPVISPMIAHVRALRQAAGSQLKVVFAGPCVSKKTESEMYAEPDICALTFRNLSQWLADEQIAPGTFAIDDNLSFFPGPATEGGLYPIDGGMIAGIKSRCRNSDIDYVCFSGIEGIISALREIEKTPPRRRIFIELLACPGGCINGPGMKTIDATLLKRDNIVSSVTTDISLNMVPQNLVTSASITARPIEKHRHSEAVIRTALQSIGKTISRDELNCGSCGYDSCRDFAEALLDGKAEENMCASYMRKLANNKANALIKAMPAGVVIVDADLRIIECNRRFASIFGSDCELVFDASPGMEGAQLSKIVPFFKVFRKVLITGEDWIDHDISVRNRQLNVSVFSIEKGRTIGAVIQDISVPHVRRDQVVKKVEEVIKLNLETVQKIAYLLGENASDTEIRLNTVLEAFGEQPEAKDEFPENYE